MEENKKVDYTVLTQEQRAKIRVGLKELLKVMIKIEQDKAADMFIAHQAEVGEKFKSFEDKMEYINDQLNMFNEAIKKETFVDRLQKECYELIIKKVALQNFFGTKEFPLLSREVKTALYEQDRLMSRYIEVLGIRIELADSKYEVKALPKSEPRLS